LTQGNGDTPGPPGGNIVLSGVNLASTFMRHGLIAEVPLGCGAVLPDV
jgi:hypothetical protein